VEVDRLAPRSSGGIRRTHKELSEKCRALRPADRDNLSEVAFDRALDAPSANAANVLRIAISVSVFLHLRREDSRKAITVDRKTFRRL
jgi:hypothetical protein